MAKRIYKYRFEIEDLVQIQLPQGARILSVASAGRIGGLVLWAMVLPERRAITRRLAVRGTGDDCEGLDTMSHIATVLDDPFVWHVFDLGET